MVCGMSNPLDLWKIIGRPTHDDLIKENARLRNELRKANKRIAELKEKLRDKL